ncbi:MAG: 2Fe-2S iron-sulfur cluster-binding protein [Aeromonas sp.]
MSMRLTLTCTQRDQETADVVTWHFAAASGLLPSTYAGQCVTLHTQLNGAPATRAYTLSSAPHEAHWAITIKDVGDVSGHLQQTLQVGDSIEAEGPFGEFHWGRLACAKPLFLSAGSGITPMWSMLKSALQQDPALNAQFIHSARSANDVIFATPLAALSAQHPQLKTATILETCAADYPYAGRLSAAHLTALVPDLLERTVFLCGPAPYMASAGQLLAELGLPATRIFQESFGAPAAPQASSPSATDASETAGRDHFWLTLKQSGKKIKIVPGQTLLAALEDAGEILPVACRAGVCGACRCTATGDFARQSVVSLSADELARGVALACSCTANGDLTVDY